MKIPRNQFGKIKTVLHGLQAAFVFLGFCLTAAVLVNGETDGRSKYYLALVCLSLSMYLDRIPGREISKEWGETVKADERSLLPTIIVLLHDPCAGIPGDGTEMAKSSESS